MKRIGIIGLGMMGRGIGINLLKAGFPLSFLQRTVKISQEDVITQGGQPHSSISQITKASQVILLHSSRGGYIFPRWSFGKFTSRFYCH